MRCLQLRFQLYVFKLVTNRNFDIGIMIVIVLNMVCMAVETHGQSKAKVDALEYINVVFIAVFTLECVMKLIALRWHFFKQPWNIFDFIIVIISILSKKLRFFC